MGRAPRLRQQSQTLRDRLIATVEPRAACPCWRAIGSRVIAAVQERPQEAFPVPWLAGSWRTPTLQGLSAPRVRHRLLTAARHD
jgi:hypothetical protein